MAGTPTHLPESRLGSTLRRDAWWTELLPVIIVLGGFGLYATLRAFEGAFYSLGTLSFAFLFSADRSAASLVAAFSRAAGARRPARVSRHLLLLPQSLLPRIFSRSAGLRRGRASQAQISRRDQHFLSSSRMSTATFYTWPLFFWAFCGTTPIKGFFFDGQFGIGVGSLILLFNVILLSFYTLSCHSLRHLAGGKMDCFSCATFGSQRAAAWKGFSLPE